MDAKKNLQIIENLKLGIISHSDMLNQKSVETVIKSLICNPFFKNEYNLLIDVRNSVIKMNSEEIQVLSDFVYESLKDTRIKKIAILTSANQTHKVVEFIHYNRESCRYRAFSSVTATLTWLGIPIEKRPQVEIKLACLNENFLYNQLNSQFQLNYLYKRVNYLYKHEYCRV
jgi:hypothetical protein